MADWKEISDELKKTGGTHDILRRKYLKSLNKLTWRNVIAYYSWWLQKKFKELQWEIWINDNDKNGFMAAIHKMDASKWLDLILHTPGGEVAATESIIDYLTNKFDDIRVVVPQLAMSGWTMIACSANKILMWKHSSLWPIDPQFNWIPAHGIMEEFERAHKEIKADNSKVAVWNPIISKYWPTLVGECEKAVAWSEKIAKNALEKRMFKSLTPAQRSPIVKKIIDELASHSVTLSHSRHLSAEACKDLWLVVEMLEDDQKLQNAVLTIHHIFMHTLNSTGAFKIIENHIWTAYVQTVQTQW